MELHKLIDEAEVLWLDFFRKDNLILPDSYGDRRLNADAKRNENRRVYLNQLESLINSQTESRKRLLLEFFQFHISCPIVDWRDILTAIKETVKKKRPKWKDLELSVAKDRKTTEKRIQMDHDSVEDNAPCLVESRWRVIEV